MSCARLCLLAYLRADTCVASTSRQDQIRRTAPTQQTRPYLGRGITTRRTHPPLPHSSQIYPMCRLRSPRWPVSLRLRRRSSITMLAATHSMGDGQSWSAARSTRCGMTFLLRLDVGSQSVRCFRSVRMTCGFSEHLHYTIPGSTTSDDRW